MTYFIGCGFIMVSSIAVGFSMSYDIRKKTLITCELYSLIEYIYKNINSFQLPIGDILKDFRSTLLEQTGFCELMRNYSLKYALENSALPISKNAYALMYEFSESLGLSYREAELSRCNYYMEAFSELMENEKAAEQKNKKICRYLPPLCALSVIVLLW